MKSIEQMKLPRLLLWSLLKMQRKYGSVTGTVCWFSGCWCLFTVIILSVVVFI